MPAFTSLLPRPFRLLNKLTFLAFALQRNRTVSSKGICAIILARPDSHIFSKILRRGALLLIKLKKNTPTCPRLSISAKGGLGWIFCDICT